MTAITEDGIFIIPGFYELLYIAMSGHKSMGPERNTAFFLALQQFLCRWFVN